MSKLLHPVGQHTVKLVKAKYAKGCILKVQCIFEGTGEHKGCQTLSRTISKHSPWADSSRPFLDQLEGFKSEADLESEIQRFLGQEFVCKIKEGKGWQRNITAFVEALSNINSTTHVIDPSSTGESHV